ncbi:MAG: PAS domain-containing protein [Verrucomicrobia bacterium]|nr:PAS domain-containing protein [Verrucomicrobiota bacterium]
MRNRIGFRQKVFFAQILIFAAFLVLIFPLSRFSVQEVAKTGLEEMGMELITELKDQKSIDGMIDYLKKQELFVYFRVSIIDDQYRLVYDTHLARELQGEFATGYPSPHPEVVEAFKKGKGYAIDWSEIFQRRFVYVAEKFDFEGKSYVLRMAFPFEQLEVMMHHFQMGLVATGVLFLLFFNGVLYGLFAYLTRPIRAIVGAIKPYQEGKIESVPQIILPKNSDKELQHLSDTINSLAAKVRAQILAATQEKEEKVAILESLVEGVIALDNEGHVKYINKTAKDMLKLSPAPALGEFLSDLEGHTELLKRCHTLLAEARKDGSMRMDTFVMQNGGKTYLDLIAVPKPYEGGAVLVIQDKSSQYQVVEMGKDFIANASHELRTPITIIKGFAETLQDLPEISPELLNDIVEKIVRNCHRMETLVKNLLTLSDIESLPFARVQECDVAALLDNCKQMLLAVHEEVQIGIQAPDELLIQADPDLLELALMNLMENAVKYSPKPAKITLTARSTNGDAQIDIADQGMGIPPDDLPHIFERFFTVDKARSRSMGGAGLGLSLVKTIIEKHGGTITATSTLGKGTTFTIRLPRRRVITSPAG